MVFKLRLRIALPCSRFENDVKMYGIQTGIPVNSRIVPFENDVKMYGIQTIKQYWFVVYRFENDVKMYGIQTYIRCIG